MIQEPVDFATLYDATRDDHQVDSATGKLLTVFDRTLRPFRYSITLKGLAELRDMQHPEKVLWTKQFDTKSEARKHIEEILPPLVAPRWYADGDDGDISTLV